LEVTLFIRNFVGKNDIVVTKYLKNTVYILVAGVVLAACSDEKGLTEKLLRAQSLMNERPDSALCILDSLGKHKRQFSRDFRMRWLLHRTNALNKLDTLFRSTAEVQELADYFDSHGKPNEQMLAHYLLGRAYYDTGESPMALRCFQDAVAKADTTARNCDYRQLSRVYGQMADLYYGQRSPQYCLTAVKLAERNAWKANDTLSAILYFERQFLAYELLNQTDSVLYVCHTAREMYDKHGYYKEKARVLPAVIWSCLKKKKYNEAYLYFQEFENNSGLFHNGEIETGLEYNYFFKGECLTGLNQLDSAEFYYRKLLKYTSDIDIAEVAYRGLMHLYARKSVADSVFKYSQLYCDANDTASVRQSSEEILRTQALYNYGRNQREAAQMRLLSFQYFCIIVVICIIVVFLMIILIYWLWQQKKKRAQSIALQNEKYNSLYVELEKAKDDLELLQNDTDAYRMQQEDKIMHLRNIISMYQDSALCTDDWNVEHFLMQSLIMKQLYKRITECKKATNAELCCLLNLVRKHIPNFVAEIDKQDYGLSEKERIICVLIRLDLSPSDIKVLLDMTKQNISNMRSAINLKLFNTKGTKGLDSNLKKL